MNKGFRIFALLTIFTLVLNSLSVLLLTVPAKADLTAGNGGDMMSNYYPDEISGHRIYYQFSYLDPGDTLTITFPHDTDEFICTGLVSLDVSVSSGWEVTSVTDSTCTIIIEQNGSTGDFIEVTIPEEHIINPVYNGSYNINLLTENGELQSPGGNLPVNITTAISDTMSSYIPGEPSSHLISYEFNTAPVAEDTFTITLPITDGFDCSGLIIGDIATASADWSITSLDIDGNCEILATADEFGSPASTLVVSISDAILNPLSAGVYNIALSGSIEPDPSLDLPVVIGAGVASDTMSNYNSEAYSSHEISYAFLANPRKEDTFTVTLPTTDGFDCTGLVIGDISSPSNWEVTSITPSTCTIVLTALNNNAYYVMELTIANNVHIKNPTTPGSYNISLSGSFEPIAEVNIPVEITALEGGTGEGNDTMSSMTAGSHSSHLLSYSFNTAPAQNDTFTITFPLLIAEPDTPGFDCTGLTTNDVTASTNWNVTSAVPGTCVVVVTAGATPSNPVEVTIASTNMVNPTEVESYDIAFSGSGESKTIQIAIVDSDTVNITGFVASNLFFDIDTGYGEDPASWDNPTVDCYSDECLDYSGTGESEQSNYTVDLGNLTMVDVNKSGASATHLNGSGFINSIYFDFSTNSASGGVITYKSLYGELQGPAHNIDAGLDLDIPTTDGTAGHINIGLSGYGIQLAAEPVYKSVGTGTQTVNCGYADPVPANNIYCIMGIIVDGENTQTALPIYTVTGPIELGRGKIDVAASIDGTVVPGSYEDQVTFIATAIY